MKDWAYAIALALFGAACATALAAEGKKTAGWSERGMFVFGELVLDFQRNLEVWGPIASTLEDCSDERYYCARGSIVRVVLPRMCDEAEKMKVGSSWTKSDVTTTVLGARSEADRLGEFHYFGTGEVLLLGDPTRPFVAYQYDTDQGIFTILYDFNKKTDFVSLLSKHDPYDLVLNKQLPSFFVHSLVTLDAFGVCHYRP